MKAAVLVGCRWWSGSWSWAGAGSLGPYPCLLLLLLPAVPLSKRQSLLRSLSSEGNRISLVREGGVGQEGSLLPPQPQHHRALSVGRFFSPCVPFGSS